MTEKRTSDLRIHRSTIPPVPVPRLTWSSALILRFRQTDISEGVGSNLRHVANVYFIFRVQLDLTGVLVSRKTPTLKISSIQDSYGPRECYRGLVGDSRGI